MSKYEHRIVGTVQSWDVFSSLDRNCVWSGGELIRSLDVCADSSAGVIGASVIVLLCIVLLVMFCVYHVHRKSQDPEIFYIDKTKRMPPPSSTNKKIGYMKALNPDHDMYDWASAATVRQTSHCSPCIFTRGFILFVTAARSAGVLWYVSVSLRTVSVTYALTLVIAVDVSDVVRHTAIVCAFWCPSCTEGRSQMLLCSTYTCGHDSKYCFSPN